MDIGDVFFDVASVSPLVIYFYKILKIEGGGLCTASTLRLYNNKSDYSIQLFNQKTDKCEYKWSKKVDSSMWDSCINLFNIILKVSSINTFASKKNLIKVKKEGIYLKTSRYNIEGSKCCVKVKEGISSELTFESDNSCADANIYYKKYPVSNGINVISNLNKKIYYRNIRYYNYIMLYYKHLEKYYDSL